jgi:hypothetical protein
MRPRLPSIQRSLLCAALCASTAGCRMDGGGLQGKIAAPAGTDNVEPGTVGGEGGNTPKPPKSDQPSVTPPAMAAADAAPLPPVMPPMADDAGAPAPTTPDAAPLPPEDAAPVSSMPAECAQPAVLPLQFTFHRDVRDTDDFTFDNEGYFLARDDRDITRLAYGGPPEMVVRNAVQGRSTIDSLRVLPGGDIIIADYMGDRLTRVDAMGMNRKLADVHSPNKLTIGPGGRVYTVGIEGDVYVSDPDSGKTMQIAHIDGRLRGLTFSLDYKTLYASDARNGQLHAIGLRSDGSYDAPRIWVRNIGPGPDGMATDACGNIYVADHSSSSLRRVSPTGQVQVVANLNNGPTSSVGFGSGQHGWDARTLYTVNADHGGMYELKVGIGAAPPPAP